MSERSVAGGYVDSVLVPLDGSELALHAMPTARNLATRLGAELHAISVVHGDDDGHRLRALSAAALGVDLDDRRVSVVNEKNAAEAIARRRSELGACIVCMGTHGRGRLSGALIGSVARSVLRRSEHPIVVLGPSADNPGWSPRPRSWPEPLTIRRIVACVDGTPTSEQILPIASAWAKALEMTMTIVIIGGDVTDPARAERSVPRYGEHAEADAYVDALAASTRETGLDVEGVAVRDPIGPASGLRANLAENPAGLVALTSHARSGMNRAHLGAQAASIVHASVAPCLVAPVL